MITIKPNQNFHKSQHCHIVVLFCLSISPPTWIIRAPLHGKVSALCVVLCAYGLYATLRSGRVASVVFVKAAVGDYRLYFFIKEICVHEAEMMGYIQGKCCYSLLFRDSTLLLFVLRQSLIT